jgi:hypothetical protein
MSDCAPRFLGMGFLLTHREQTRRLPHLRTLQAVTQFARGEYQPAMDTFLTFNVNPALVIAMFPAETISGRLHVPRDRWMDLFGAVEGARLEPESESSPQADGPAKGLLKSVANLGLGKKGSTENLRASQMKDDAASVHDEKAAPTAMVDEGERSRLEMRQE